MSAITFKRGDTFSMTGVVKVAGVVQDMTGWTIKSQIRKRKVTEASGLISELVCAWVSPELGALIISDATTSDWPACDAEIDIRVTSPTGDKTTTSTAQITIAEAVTRG